YACFITDVFSRTIVGWTVATNMRTQMVLDALEHARFNRGAVFDSLICHSDAGSQFTSIRYGERLAELGALPSIGTVADSYDNALAETVNGLYKTELIRRQGPWRTVDDVELATLQWVHWFNTNASTPPSATSRPPSSRPPNTLKPRPANWLKPNSPNLHQTQGLAIRLHRSRRETPSLSGWIWALKVIMFRRG
ncbi:MAG: hypothetical protein JWN39_3722, partial [Ilumatobacteraceae bacterium]|nr:hypothetical protein [Ilumatobacteraceae bacterium]